MIHACESVSPGIFFREWLTALATPLIAILGLWIAFQQFRVNRYQFRKDLSQKRLAVYSGVKKLLDSGNASFIGDYSPLKQFDADTMEAVFLFGAEVVAYLEKLRNAYIGILNISIDNADGLLDDDEERNSALARRRELRKWMREQSPELHLVFKPYLDFTKA